MSEKMKYLQLLFKQFPTIQDVCTEIINLKAILNLPKGTELFLTDIHGEDEAFTHVLRSASGVIKAKIEDTFGNHISTKDKKSLATLIFYPEQKLEIIKKEEGENLDEWYRMTFYRLVTVCKQVSHKYTRSKVRKALPKEFSYIIDELLHVNYNDTNKEEYYQQIIESIIELKQTDKFITALCEVIRKLTVDRLHLIGDIYDRGPGADIIMEELVNYHSCDVQWGNHDILWMAASTGQWNAMATALRVSMKYDNMKTLESGYGINLLPLARLAMDSYGSDPCNAFKIKADSKSIYTREDELLLSRMHKAISVIEFKLDAVAAKRRPEFGLEGRILLDKINFETGTITIKGKEYPLKDKEFPTVDPKDPFKLTKAEEQVMEKLEENFTKSYKLKRHMDFLFDKGSLYLIYNDNVLYHGCVPANADGSFKEFEVEKGVKLKGRALLDKFDELARKAYYQNDGIINDWLWYLWCGSCSPLFGKDQMTTFERYFVSDKSTQKEHQDPYFKLRDDEAFCSKVLEEFGLNIETSHIINGHIPVKVKEGESPIKANGRLLVIDGGFSKAYQGVTGIAGYTLIFNSYGLRLSAHGAFESVEKAITEEQDILFSTFVLDRVMRKRVADTGVGVDIQEQIEELELLLEAYKDGQLIKKWTGK